MRSLLVAALALPLGGCFWVVAGGAAEGGYVAGQKTSAGTTVSDQWVTTKVKSALIGDSRVSARHVNVTTVAGVVTLRGFAATADERRRAVADAREIEGVKGVIDRLSVSPAPEP